jgi:hypothetical protein
MIQAPALELTNSQREYFVSRVRSGIYYVNYKNYKLKVLQPTIEGELDLNEVYLSSYYRASQDGLKTEEEMLQWMVDHDLWSIEEDEKMEKISKDIEKLKREIYNARNNQHLRETIRSYIRTAESALRKLEDKKNFYHSNTCEGVASSDKMFAFIEQNTLWNNLIYDFKDENGPSISYVLNSYYSQILPERTVRYLARTEPWRSFWLLHSSNLLNLFNNNSRELSVDQRNVFIWSKMYDSVYESMDCPSDFVIEDDDMLDGWFLLQKEKREKAKAENELNSLSEKTKNADEVFLIPKSQQDLDRINSMNDTQAKMVKKQRETLIKQKGTVSQLDFMDEKLKIGAMAREKFKDNFRR